MNINASNDNVRYVCLCGRISNLFTLSCAFGIKYNITQEKLI